MSERALLAEFRRLQKRVGDSQVRLQDLETVLDLLPTLVAFVDPRLRFIWVNQPYADWYRKPRAEIIGQKVRETIAPESWKGAQRHMKAALAGERVNFENIAFGHDHLMRAVQVSYLPVATEAGRIRGFIGLVQDITRQKLAEQERDKGREELHRAQAEIKTLQGIIPICCSCKKIRDDNGDWHMLEAYLREHSRADFTHGLCPDCAERLYPHLECAKRRK